MNTSTFVAYPIGNTDWTKNISAKPTFLNYSTSVQTVLSAARLSTDWYEECWENLIGEVCHILHSRNYHNDRISY